MQRRAPNPLAIERVRLSRSALTFERLLDRDALRGDVAGRHRLTGAAIPVAGVLEIAFDAVKMRVHPRRGGREVILDERMRARPIAVGEQFQSRLRAFHLVEQGQVLVL